MITGWMELKGSTYYFDDSGYMTTGWKTIDGKSYYFYSGGSMATNKWIGGYYVGADGVWDPDAIVTGWVKDAKGWKYVHKDGSVTKKNFEQIGSHTHYFDGNGYMVTGWKTIKGKKYYFDGNGFMSVYWKTISGKSYFFFTDGHMAENMWIGDYYVGANGVWDPNKVK